jgi:predicted membrane protein
MNEMIESKQRDETCDERWRKYQHSPTGKILAGIWVVIVGAILLTRQMGFPYPEWLFTWPSMLVAVGIYIGARHLFCNPGWFILVTIGCLFLWDSASPEMNLAIYIWPILIILVGIAMIFKPHRRKHFHGRHAHFRHLHDKAESYKHQWETEYPKTEQEYSDWRERRAKEESTKQDYLDTISIFGAVRKNILSKDFKGGEITCVLGGAEINFMQADINGRVVLDVTQVLGGTKLLIPSNWDVQPEMIAILGGIEDKRQLNNNISPDKVLVIKGTSILGGIEIKSF